MHNHRFSRREVLRAAGIAFVTGGLGELGADEGSQPVAAGPAVEPDGTVHGRRVPQLILPFIDCQGTAFECGEMLGCLWKSALTLEAQQTKDSRPWWKSPRCAPLMNKYCPHLPDVYLGMAKGAGVSENAIGQRAPEEGTNTGCTSFALTPEATLEGIPISGQTKDVAAARGWELVVLRMKMTGAPSLLTMTYTGSTWLFGHGFVQGGTSIFRNSMYVPGASGRLPYEVWGLVAQHCPTVEDVTEMTDRYGIDQVGHVTVADERGGIIGIEWGRDGIAYLRPQQGIYVHANCVLSDGPLRQGEKDSGLQQRSNSLHRAARLSERLQAERGHLTAALCYNAMCDHNGYPASVCRHETPQLLTAAAVIAEPTLGLLHVTPGAPCRNWPRTYSVGLSG